MTDIVSSLRRSQMMAGIRNKDTEPELRVRRLLHRQGYRFRLHCGDLPGSPDIVLPRRKVVVFVHGCFWHLHEGCKLARIPRSREEFWRTKLTRNRDRDSETLDKLKRLGWRVLVVWECYLRKCRDDEKLSEILLKWLENGEQYGELSDVSL